MENPVFIKRSTGLIAALSAIVFAVSIFGADFIHQQGFMESHKTISACQSQDCTDSSRDPFCASSCLAVFKNTIQTLPQDFIKLAFAAFSFILLFTIAVFSFRGIHSRFMEIFIRKRREKFVLSFFKQLGHWLILLGKRDPSLVFASL